MKTRSSPSKKPTGTAKTSPIPSLIEDKDPPVMVFLPKHERADSRILSLLNPRTGDMNKYLFVPDTGVFEFKKISPPSDSQKSILTAYPWQTSDELSQDDALDAKLAKKDMDSTDGYFNKIAFAVIATPIDPVWLILSILSPPNAKMDSSKRLFQPLDDLFDDIPDDSSDLRNLLNQESFREMLSTKMETVCDTVEAGDEKMYRLSEAKLAKKVITIAERFGGTGFPLSMEDQFVRRALETPILAVKREETSATVKSDAEESQATVLTTTTSVKTNESQSSLESISATTTKMSTPETELSFTSATSIDETPPSGPPLDIIRLQRIRTALSFILASYIPPNLSNMINKHISSPESSINFTPLAEHLKQVGVLRAEALASRSMGDFSRKRTLDDEEAAESRAEKKRRLEEEERKKKLGESRGVRDLKKVNTTGMKKMSDFFGKAAPKTNA